MDDTRVIDATVIETARETATTIQSDPRMAVVAFNKRLLIESLAREVEEINDRILAARHERAVWMNSIPDIAVRHANENQWCAEFDRAMEKAGLPFDRDTEEEITVYGSITAEVSIDADDLGTAYFGDDYDTTDNDTTSVTFTFELDDDLAIPVTVERSGTCGCEQVDRYPSGYELSEISSIADSFYDEHPGASFTISVSSCSNCN